MRLFRNKFPILLISVIFSLSNTSFSAEYQPWSVPDGHSSSWFKEGDEIHEHINGSINEGITILESKQRPWQPMVSFLKVQTPKQVFLLISINSAYTNAPMKISKALVMLDGRAWNHHSSLEMSSRIMEIKNWSKVNKYAKSDNAHYAHYMIKYISKSDIDEIKRSKSMQVKIGDLEFLIDLKQFDLDRLKWFKL